MFVPDDDDDDGLMVLTSTTAASLQIPCFCLFPVFRSSTRNSCFTFMYFVSIFSLFSRTDLSPYFFCWLLNVHTQRVKE
jgi:hypothetical protein